MASVHKFHMYGYIGKISTEDANSVTEKNVQTVYIKNTEVKLETPISVGEIVYIDSPYLVGGNNLLLFIDGIKAKRGESYEEIGSDGQESNCIRLLENITDKMEASLRIYTSREHKIDKYTEPVSYTVSFEEVYTHGPMDYQTFIPCPEYIVGSHSLDVYVEGTKGQLDKVYREVGKEGEVSNHIQILNYIRPDSDVCIRVSNIQSKPLRELEVTDKIAARLEQKEIYLHTQIKEGDTILTPDYVVGSCELEIFIEGIKARNGITYREIGVPGTLSNEIEILHTLPKTMEVCMRNTHPVFKSIDEFVLDSEFTPILNTKFLTDCIITEEIAQTPIKKGYLVKIDDYDINTNALDIFMDGVKIEPGDIYREIDVEGDPSHVIQFLVDIPETSEILIKEMHFEQELVTDPNTEILESIKFADLEVNTPIYNNELIRVPKYLVANNRIDVFINGKKAKLGTEYIEVGEANSLSYYIRFINDISEDDEVSVRVTQISKKKYNEAQTGVLEGKILHSILRTPVEAGQHMSISPYIVGANQIEVYVDGKFIDSNEGYREIGLPGTSSIEIEFLESVGASSIVCVKTVKIQDKILGFGEEYKQTLDKFTITAEYEVSYLNGPLSINDILETKDYIVGSNMLALYLNGEKLILGKDYYEIGAKGDKSNYIQIRRDIEENNVLTNVLFITDTARLYPDDSVMIEYKNSEEPINTPVDINELVIVDRYVVGQNSLFIYINGLLAQKDKDYIEVGTPGNTSTRIQFLKDLGSNDKVVARITRNFNIEFDEINLATDSIIKNIQIEENKLNLEIPDHYYVDAPEYQVGSFNLEVFVNGKKLIKNIEYKEIGNEKDISTEIQLLRYVSSEDLLLFRNTKINYMNALGEVINYKRTEYVTDISVKEIELDTPILEYSRVEVDEYTVGANEVELYIDGIRSSLGVSYMEEGEPNEKSNLIRVLCDIPGDMKVVVKQIVPKTEHIDCIVDNVVKNVTIYERKLDSPIFKNGLARTTPYIVGSGNLNLYFDGIKLDERFYQEVGAKGEVSNTIRVLDFIPATYVSNTKSIETLENQLGTSKKAYVKGNISITKLETPISANTEIEITEYLVGHNQLDVYVDGLRLTKGIEYIEVGQEHDLSNKIMFTSELSKDKEVIVKCFGLIGKVFDNKLALDDDEMPENKYKVITEHSIIEKTINSDIAPHSTIIIPEYVVGNGSLELYLNGEKITSPEYYREVGIIGKTSTEIEYLHSETVNDTLFIRVLKYNTEYPQNTEKVLNNIEIIETNLGTPIHEGEFVRTGEYVVGSNNLEVYENGILLLRNIDYKEVGNIGERSVTIKMLKDIKFNTAIYSRITEYNYRPYDSSSTGINVIDAFEINWSGNITSEEFLSVPAFIVGSNKLEVFLNGKKLQLHKDYIEIGETGQYSEYAQLLYNIEATDTLTFRVHTYNEINLNNGLAIQKTPGQFVTHIGNKEKILNTPITANTPLWVYDYTVGSNELGVFVDGIKAKKEYVYKEIGNKGQVSNAIVFLVDIPEDLVITIKKLDVYKKYLTTTDNIASVSIKEIEINAPISKGQIVNIPEYTVGHNQLSIFADGLLLKQNDVYSEIGNFGETSNSIIFNTDVTNIVNIRVFGVENKFIKDLDYGEKLLANAIITEKYYRYNIQTYQAVCTPTYIVGENQLEVYLDGVKCIKDETYIELGEVGTSSTQIRFLENIPSTMEVCIRAFTIRNNNIDEVGTQINISDIGVLSDIIITEKLSRGIITPNSVLQTGEYKVGANAVDIYVDGILLEKNTDYFETGKLGETSTSIQFASAFDINTEYDILAKTIQFIETKNMDANEKTISQLHFYESYLKTPIAANEIVTVDEYEVGANYITVFIDGHKLAINDSFEEVGKLGEKSNKIKFLLPISNKHKVYSKTMVTTSNEFQNTVIGISDIYIQEKSVSTPCAKGTQVSVADYVVGNNQVEVYVDGLKTRVNEVYKEVGAPNTLSNVIEFIHGIGADKEILIKVLSYTEKVLPSMTYEYTDKRYLTNVARSSFSIPTPISAGTELVVPEYQVGKNRMSIYIDGMKATPGETYSEVGIFGSVSNTIKILNDFDSTINITAEYFDTEMRNIMNGNKIISDIQFIETHIPGPIEQNSIVTVPEYIVGSEMAMVYVDGLLIKDGVYKEIGNPGSKSTQIQFIEYIEPIHSATFRVTSFDEISAKIGDVGIDNMSISEVYLKTPIAANTPISIDTYTVGKNQVEVFIDGVKCNKNETFIEIGVPGTESNIISLSSPVLETNDICIRVYNINNERLENKETEYSTVNPYLVSLINNEAHIEASLPIASGTYFDVRNPYIVDSNNLVVYLDGIKLAKGAAYLEVGNKNESSHVIQFISDIPGNSVITVNTITMGKEILNKNDEVISNISYAEVLLETPLNKNRTPEVPPYIVGSDTLDVYIDGVKAILGETYNEYGEPGTEANKIKIIEHIDATHDVCVRVSKTTSKPVSEFNVDARYINNVVIYEKEFNAFIPKNNYLEIPQYIVGAAQVEIYLEGLKLNNTIDFIEVGTPGTISDTVKMLIDVKNDKLEIRVHTYTAKKDSEVLELPSDAPKNIAVNNIEFIETGIPAGILNGQRVQIQNFEVGKNQVEVFLDGLKLTNGKDFEEVLNDGFVSNKIKFLLDFDLSVGEHVCFIRQVKINKAEVTESSDVVTRYDISNYAPSTPIATASDIMVNEYEAGKKQIEVSLDGLRCKNGEEFTEVIKNMIKINGVVSNDTDVSVNSINCPVEKKSVATSQLVDIEISEIAQGSFPYNIEIEVPEYTVGLNQIQVYINGALSDKNSAYVEVGDLLSTSNKIRFIENVGAEDESIIIRVTKPHIKYKSNYSIIKETYKEYIDRIYANTEYPLTPLANNTVIRTEPYIVGWNEISVYIDGIKTYSGEAYKELGSEGEWSQNIQLLCDVSEHSDICIKYINSRRRILNSNSLLVSDITINEKEIKLPVVASQYVDVPEYKVGSGTLEVYIDGILTSINDGAYTEVGLLGQTSTRIQFLVDINDTDVHQVHHLIVRSIMTENKRMKEVTSGYTDFFALETDISQHIEAKDIIEINKYIVGSNAIEFFINGIRLTKNGEYIEIGEEGDESTSVQFLIDVPLNAEILYRHIFMKKENFEV